MRARSDLGQVATNIFRKIRKKRLDSPVDKPPDGQITSPRREPLSCPGRGAAPLRRCAAEPEPAAERAARWAASATGHEGLVRSPPGGTFVFGDAFRRPRVPDAVQRPLRCSAEPGPTAEVYGPRISSAPLRAA